MKPARAPFTIISALIVIVASAATGALSNGLTAAHVNRWGFHPTTDIPRLLSGVITANYLVDKPVAILSSTAMIVIFLGWIELRYGLLAAIITWFGGTVAGTLLATLVWWPFAVIGMARPMAEILVPEVGSSAATWAAVGFTLGWPGSWSGSSMIWGVAVTAFLSGLLIAYQTFTDVEHLIAFLFGAFVLAPALADRARSVTLDPTAVIRVLGALSGTVAILTAWVATGSLLNVMAIAGALLFVSALWPAPRGVLLALLVVSGGSSILALPNIATIGLFAVTIIMVIRPGLAESLGVKVR